MKAVNEGSKLVARALAILNEFDGEGCRDCQQVWDAIVILEEALEKLVTDIN